MELMHYNSRIVMLGCILLGSTAGVLGKFIYLKKQSLIGDMLSHALLPGVIGAFWIVEQKSWSALMLGALISGGLAMVLFRQVGSDPRIKPQGGLAICLCSFFSLGMLLLSLLQNSGLGRQSGIQDFIFGRAASMRSAEVLQIGVVCSLCLLVCVVWFRALKVVCFDRAFARSLGLRVPLIETVLYVAVVLLIISGIEAVGSVLISALLILPATIASLFTYRLGWSLLLCALFGGLAAAGGAGISYQWSSMPTGPWIVMLLGLILSLSLVFAPYRGFGVLWFKRHKNRKKIAGENFLKSLLKLEGNYPKGVIPLGAITRGLSLQRAIKTASHLHRKGLIVSPHPRHWKLSTDGRKRAKAILRSHRLWESYLTLKMNYKADHVHPGAEAVEHLISPELEKLLEKELDKPERDPHQKRIDYSD